MTFVVEDGTGLADANSFTTPDYFKAYWSARGTNVTEDDATIQPWLVKATDYIAGRFVNLKGSPTYPDVQALPFPRDNVDGMPRALQEATCEYAMRVKTAPLAADPVVDNSGRVIDSTTKKVGPIEKTVKYATSPNGYTLQPYPSADMKMRPLLGAGGGRVIR